MIRWRINESEALQPKCSGVEGEFVRLESVSYGHWYLGSGARRAPDPRNGYPMTTVPRTTVPRKGYLGRTTVPRTYVPRTILPRV